MPAPIRIAIIEDETPIRRFLRASLSPDEAEWHEAVAGEEGIRLVARCNPDVVLLDLGLPDIDGLEVLRRLREWTQVPVIVLSARGQERDKIAALDAGADDYLTKPFAVGELMARIRVALRHVGSAADTPNSVLEFEGLTIDFPSRVVKVSGVVVHLTQIEFKLLTLLTKHSGMVVTQKQLLTQVWGPAFQDSTHTLRVHMANLRHKLEPDADRPKYIRTETGVGYRFIAE